MEHIDKEKQSALTTDVLGAMMAKFGQLPTADRDLIVLSATEATARIVAGEIAAKAKKEGLSKREMAERIDEFANAFAFMTKWEVMNRLGD